MGISQSRFVEKNEPTWHRFETLLDELEKDHPAVPAREFPELYRLLCQHLSIARHRGYSAAIIRRLNPLVERGHALLYGSRVGRWGALLDYVAGGFAHQVRREWRFLLLATALFVVPIVGIFWWVTTEPDWAYHVLGPAATIQFESMYADAEAMQRERTSDSNLMMFGFYIYNNVGIALRTFASGLIFGFGALFILAYNGVFFGAVAGHLYNVNLAHNLWPFVVGHGSFELTALVLAGQAGFKIGLAPIWPGRRRRLHALRQAARDSVGLIAGFSVMLVIAAFIEAFWSARDLPPSVKYTVGAALWALVLGYFVFAGRRGHGSR